MDSSQIVSGDIGVSKCDAFVFDTDSAARTITVQASVLDNTYAGDYSIMITGWNIFSSGNTETLTIGYKLKPDCSQASITVPSSQTFLNTLYDATGTYSESFIGIRIAEDRAFPIDLFVSSVT